MRQLSTCSSTTTSLSIASENPSLGFGPLEAKIRFFGRPSQWENVIVWDDGLGRSEIDRRRWLYTAITRAERGLVLLA